MKELFTEQEYQTTTFRQQLKGLCDCGNEFYKTKRQFHCVRNGKFSTMFCTKKCAWDHQITEHIVSCAQCAKSFGKHANQVKRSINHFCSRSCGAKYRNAHKTKGFRRSKFEICLVDKLRNYFKELTIETSVRNNGFELDIVIPELKAAIEVNGVLHYKPIFGEEKLIKTQLSDKTKKKFCAENSIDLLVIDISSITHFTESKAMPYMTEAICFVQKKVEDKIK